MALQLCDKSNSVPKCLEDPIVEYFCAGYFTEYIDFSPFRSMDAMMLEEVLSGTQQHPFSVVGRTERIHFQLQMKKMMAESSMRKFGGVKKDIISELPQNVVESILCFLPIDDAVRTSVLSRAWRHCWTMIPHLIFDTEFIYSITEKYSILDDPELKAYRFVSVINKVLVLHTGPISTFSLIMFVDHDFDSNVVHDYINQWISLLSRNGIKRLILADFLLRESIAHNFSSLGLTHLRLLSIWFPYTPACGRFTDLRILELVDATSKFGGGIFDCPVLEKLTLIGCEELYPNNFRAPNLKCLIQVYREIDSNYSLAGLENLEEYSFMLLGNPTEQPETFNVVIVPGGLHKIEKFSVAREFIEYLAAGDSPNRLSKPLAYLKTLNISDIDFTEFTRASARAQTRHLKHPVENDNFEQELWSEYIF